MKNAGKKIFGAVSVAAIAAAVSVFVFDVAPFTGTSVQNPVFSYEELTGSRFLPVPPNPLALPRTRQLVPPAFPEATSIWGSNGRDFRGHIWMGVSASSPGMSAHLLEFIPQTETWHDRGAVIEHLRAAGLYRKGEGQIKIHSKIVPGADGWLYFASSDEEGERAQAELPPRWGGHLWRIHPEDYTWEHLLAVPEGLVAVSGVGRYIYALGYWGHVLYQYDTATGESRRTRVGSAQGHVSRNFLADVRGHAYVPRLSERDGKVAVALVEYDETLKEIGATPLAFYLGKESAESNHGIVALAYLPDGRMVFATHLGRLYVIRPVENGPADVSDTGWLHPDGSAYTPSLFAYGGNNWIAGIAQRGAKFEWVVAELQTRVSAAFPLDTKGLKGVLLYGSLARDDAGRVYLGGWATASHGGQQPLVLQVDPGR